MMDGQNSKGGDHDGQLQKYWPKWSGLAAQGTSLNGEPFQEGIFPNTLPLNTAKTNASNS